jgi:hypothetical protein
MMMIVWVRETVGFWGLGVMRERVGLKKVQKK